MHCWLHIAKLYVRSLFQHRMQEDSPTTMRMPLPTRELAPRRRVGVGDGAEPENCPICLSSLSFAVDTNCSHTFCARCILSYWEHDQWPRAARCPVCRNGVICAHYKWNNFEIFSYRCPCCSLMLHYPTQPTQRSGTWSSATISECLASQDLSVTLLPWCVVFPPCLCSWCSISLTFH